MNRICSFVAAVFVVAVLCLCFGTTKASAQIGEHEFRKILIDAAGLTPAEISVLDSGKVVVKSLPASDKQELSAVGIMRLKDLPATTMNGFREALSQKGGDSMKFGGRFGEPPSIDDLQKLELEDGAFEQLAKCSPGSCDMNMPAEVIRKFQRIDWAATDNHESATQTVREMLLGYVQSYSARGDSGLGRYDNRRKTVDLAASHRSLLANSLFIKDFAPEFFDYLKSFPDKDLAYVESTMHWSVVDFGLKPSIMLSHSAAYTKQTGSENQLFVASKQFFASRYLDASLTLSLLLRVSTGNSVDTYLIFADRSRSDALEGPLGGFSRGVAQKESVERIKGVLEKTHIRLLIATRPPLPDTQGEFGILGRIIRREDIFLLFVAVGSVLVALLAFFFWRRRKVGESRSK